MGGFYMQYLEIQLVRISARDNMSAYSRLAVATLEGQSLTSATPYSGYTCHVLVNGREYQTDLAYASDLLAQENAAMRAFMVCRNFSVNGGMLARNGIVQGLPADETNRKHRRGRQHSSSHKSSHSRRSGHHSSSSSTASCD
ncbi:uncharacterized protein E0L32_001377 [Thyridium curvatum]|uniref:Uncharacterized protein n=1 Tax=Thyridium curvatum TaxID=1093900 RepID=A0A507B0V7_9PEZI|nr:uncharacterized protein E0L32_001377 [Thyridium curvatum]TPX10180.1 hypothetical protein E0L32_001377 [Thyridium curvatum]